METRYITIIIAVVAIAFLLLLFKIIKAPLKLLFKLFLNAVMGFVILFIVNYLGAYIDVSIGINWVNALVAGILGVPGVVLLLLIKYVF